VRAKRFLSSKLRANVSFLQEEEKVREESFLSNLSYRKECKGCEGGVRNVEHRAKHSLHLVFHFSSANGCARNVNPDVNDANPVVKEFLLCKSEYYRKCKSVPIKAVFSFTATSKSSLMCTKRCSHPLDQTSAYE
jgi:hypothetical protein